MDVNCHEADEEVGESPAEDRAVVDRPDCYQLELLNFS